MWTKSCAQVADIVSESSDVVGCRLSGAPTVVESFTDSKRELEAALRGACEEFIEGRELTVGVLGNKRLEVFPVWEMFFDSLPESAPDSCPHAPTPWAMLMRACGTRDRGRAPNTIDRSIGLSV